MLTVTMILVVAALICAIASAMGKPLLWVAVVLLAIVEALQVLPLK